MATTTTINTNYVGKAAGEIVGKSYAEADTIARNFVTVRQDINSTAFIRKLDYSNGRQAYSCGFNPSGDVDLNERALTPVKFKQELELCKEDFREYWNEDLMGSSAWNNNMHPEVEDVLLAEIMADNAIVTENLIWQGDTDNGGDEFDGFLKLFAADSDVIKANNGITPSGNAVTKTTVIAELEAAIASLPTSLRRKDYKLAVSSNVYQAFMFYMIDKGITALADSTTRAYRYGDFELIELNGLPDNTIVLAQPKNLYFGTGLLADHNEIRIKDMDDVDLSGTVRYKSVFNAGVQYARGEEIVWYLTTEAA